MSSRSFVITYEKGAECFPRSSFKIPSIERPEARDRFAQAILARELGTAADAIRDAIVRLQRAGVVRTETFCQRTKKKGLRVVPFDERPSRGDLP